MLPSLMKSDRLGVYTKMDYRDVLTWLQVLASSIRRLVSTSTSVCVVVMFFGTQSGISINSDNSEY